MSENEKGVFRKKPLIKPSPESSPLEEVPQEPFKLGDIELVVEDNDGSGSNENYDYQEGSHFDDDDDDDHPENNSESVILDANQNLMVVETERIRIIRRDIHALMNSVKVLNPSREVSLALTNLEKAKMFLDMRLKELDQENLYPESMNPESKKIEPTAEAVDGHIFNENGLSQTSGVKRIRSVIQTIIDAYQDHNFEGIFVQTSWLALIEAKMWLGMELSRIKSVLEGNDDLRKLAQLKSEERKAAIEKQRSQRRQLPL
jgi:hypothetical protein